MIFFLYCIFSVNHLNYFVLFSNLCIFARSIFQILKIQSQIFARLLFSDVCALTELTSLIVMMIYYYCYLVSTVQTVQFRTKYEKEYHYQVDLRLKMQNIGFDIARARKRLVVPTLNRNIN